MHVPAPAQLTLRAKTIGYSAAWLIALFATDPSLGLWSLAWMFPLGLFALIPPEWQEAGRAWLIAGFAIYVIHAVFYFRNRCRSVTYIWFALLILLLVGNVAGCRSMNHPH